jgi:hypothetical protein
MDTTPIQRGGLSSHMEADGFRYPPPLMRGRPLGLVALLCALAAVAAGCGESSAKKKADFLAKANSICTHFEGLQNQVQVPSVNPLAAKTTHVDRAQWGLGIKQLAYLGTQEVQALGKLKAPKELSDGFQEFLTTKGGAFALMLEGADAAKRNRVSEIKAPINTARSGLAKAQTQARALGLEACA